MIAAISGVAAFAFIAFEMLAADRGIIASVRGQLENAQLKASADAGLAAAIYGLSLPDPSQRWSIDGRSRTLRFGDSTMTIVVEDEHGKIPLNRLNEDEIRQMFAAAGASGDQLDQLVDCMEDWTDEDDDPRPHGAEAPDYVAQGIKPRNSDFQSLGELALIKGMDSALFARLEPAITVFFGENGSFSTSTAQPLALAVMSGTRADSPDVVEREKELAGQTPATDSPHTPNLIGRPLTVRVTVHDSEGGTFERATIVELTGMNPSYWVRYVE
jgi:general secretion pathway protein K